MATTPQALGITAPQGGFQNGGWYAGRQFWNGQLGDPGVIINPNQQGYNQPVSAAVNAQTSVAAGKAPGANQAYINAGAPVGTSTNTTIPVGGGSLTGSSAQSYLDSYGTAANVVASNIPQDTSEAATLAQIEAQVAPKMSEPTAPNLTQTYQNLVVTTGLSGLQTQQTTLLQQQAQIQSSLEAQQANEESTGGTVPLNVIAGRETEEQRQAQIKLDSISLQLGVVNQAITNAQNGISMVMQYTQQDYQNASTQYENEFNNNMAIYGAMQTEVKNQQDYHLQLQQVAAANLQTITNLLSSGNISYSQLSPSEQTQVNSLELQAGLPIGTMSQIQLSPSQRVQVLSTYRGQTQALVYDPITGQMQLQTYGSIDNSLTPNEQITQSGKQNVSDAEQSAAEQAANGMSLQDMQSIYAGTLSPAQIKSIYTNAQQ